MQEYLQKTRFGAAMDEVGAALMMLFVSEFFFILLWGLRLTSIVAGLAGFGLMELLRMRTRTERLKRREMQLRHRIGGELRLESWTVCPPRRAHFEAALLLSEAYPLILERTLDEGVICRIEKEGVRMLIRCAQLHREEKLNARDVAELQRACARLKADRGVLCGAEAEGAAKEQAEMDPKVKLIGRERMITLAGAASPASDRELVALGKRKQMERDLKAIRRRVLSFGRAKKYGTYAVLLLMLYLLTGQGIYQLSGVMCLALMGACRAQRAHSSRLCA